MIALQFPTEYNCFVQDAILRRVSDTEIEGCAKCGAGGWFTTKDPGWNDFTLHFVIQSAKLNGQPLTRPWFYFDEITRGGKLELVMGYQPNRSWGSKPEDAPPAR